MNRIAVVAAMCIAALGCEGSVNQQASNVILVLPTDDVGRSDLVFERWRGR